VRVTLGPETTAADVDAFLHAFAAARTGLLRAAESVA
jgi:cysteine sulfinate desulfinase/cysteine desulfurase-like protein